MNRFGVFTETGGAVENGVDRLTDSEVFQLANINTSTISTVQWGHVGTIDQSITTTSVVAFDSIKADTTFHDNVDDTKKMHFQLNGITTGTDRKLTIIDEDLTLVGDDNVQTLTNKTLTAPTISAANISASTITTPTITTPTITGAIMTKNSEIININDTLTTAESGKIVISTAHTGITLTLPTITLSGLEFFFINEDATPNTVRVQTSGANTIDGATTTYIDMNTQYHKMHLISSIAGIWYTF